MLAACTRTHTAATIWLTGQFDESIIWLRRRRWWFVAVILIASVLDLVISQTILTTVAQHDELNIGKRERNGFALMWVMTWWAWPIRVGVPIVMVVRDIRKGEHGLLAAGAALYTAVVMWNTYQLYLVNGALA